MKMIDVNDKIRAKVEALPDSPGVYRWKDRDGRIIYVGKAKNLKNRVRSYVREDKNRSPKVAAMIRHAEDLDITMTATEMEALILECNLIKEIHPKYNISLRDDKSYPYVKITTNEEWPRIFVTRNIRHDDGARYFGPFTDVGSLRTTLSLLRLLSHPKLPLHESFPALPPVPSSSLLRSLLPSLFQGRLRLLRTYSMRPFRRKKYGTGEGTETEDDGCLRRHGL